MFRAGIRQGWERRWNDLTVKVHGNGIRAIRARVRRGMTLTEVIVAAFTLALAAGIAATLFPAATELSVGSGDTSLAAAIVERKLEQLRSFPAERLAGASLAQAGVIDTAGTQPYSFTIADELGQELQQGTGALRLTGTPDLIQCEVQVSWTEPHGRTRRVAGITRIASRRNWVRP